MKIVTKVSAGYAVAVVLLLLVGGGAFALAQTTKSNASNSKTAIAATRVTKQYQIDATSVAVDANSLAYDYASHGDPSDDYQSFKAAVAASAADSRAVHRLNLTSAEASQLSAADRALQVYINQTKQIVADFKTNTPASIADGNKLVAALAFHSVIDPLGNLVALRAKSVNASVDAAASRANTDEILVLVGVLAAAAVAVLLSLILARTIRRPLIETGRVLGRIAEGDLTVRMERTADDEIGVMAAALNTSVSTMHDVIVELDAQAETLSDFAERTVSHASNGNGHAAGEDGGETLADLASHLNAMISIFTIERHQNPQDHQVAEAA